MLQALAVQLALPRRFPFESLRLSACRHGSPDTSTGNCRSRRAGL